MMRSLSNRVFWLAGLLLAAGCAAPGLAPGSPEATEPDTLRVVTTVSPITNLVYNIAGDRAAIVGIVPEGVNSHTYEPAPSDVRQLADADLIFINGLKLEEPVLRLAEANAGEQSEIVLLGDQTITPEAYVYDFSFPLEAGSPNPHLWPNPFYALRYAEIVRDKLSERDPQHAEYYAANYALVAERIEALDGAIRATVESIPPENRKLLTYHDSWAYFAPVYGMTVVGAIQPSDFAEPSARELAALIDQLKAEQVPAIFGSEVFPSTVLEQIARETGASYVDDLRDDDLPGQPGDDLHSYFGLMAANLRTMAAALGGDPTILDTFDTRNIPGTDSRVEQSQ